MDRARSDGLGAAADADPGEPRRDHGAGRRGAAAGGVQRGGGGAARVAVAAGLAYPVPIHCPVGVLPPRRLRRRSA